VTLDKDESAREPQVRALLGLHAAGELEPVPVELGPMPPNATPAMRAIAADIALRIGLRLAEGDDRPLPYSRSEAVRAGFVRTEQGASYVLRRLTEAGVIQHVGNLPRRGRPRGTKLYAPPGWRFERGPVTIEAGHQYRRADLVGAVDQPGETAGVRAVQPDGELPNELLVGGGEHGPEGTERIGGRGS
jgi:hypothetical protein